MEHISLGLTLRRWAWLLLLGTLLPLRADPENFMVGDYTFVRPADWQWMEPAATTHTARLKKPGRDTESDVWAFFYVHPANSDNTPHKIVSRMRAKYFRQKDKEGMPELEKVRHGTNTVHYAIISGTFISYDPNGNAVPGRDTKMIVAVIPGKTQHVVVRMSTAKDSFANHEPAFRKMVASPFGEK